MKPGTHEEIIIEEDAYPYVFYLASIPSSTFLLMPKEMHLMTTTGL
jgi:hypothetical protein